MKKTSLLIAYVCSLLTQAQNELSTSRGTIRFDASVPVFEEIKAINNDVDCFVSLETGEINCVVFIPQFKFEKELMQKHFNDHYLESDRYPRASFIGRIEKLNYKTLSEKPTEHQIKGILKIHGKSKPLFCKAQLSKKNNELKITTTFIVNTEDFTIQIPAVVASKISKQVAILLEATLTK